MCQISQWMAGIIVRNKKVANRYLFLQQWVATLVDLN